MARGTKMARRCRRKPGMAFQWDDEGAHRWQIRM